MSTVDRVLSYAPAPPRPRRSWMRTTILVVGTTALLLAMAVLGIRWFRGNSAATNAMFAAQVPTLRTAYLKDEGPTNRGPKFEELALALNHKILAGQPPTQAEMVQLLGPPDLMQRDAAGRGLFAYFYDRFADNDWVVYVDYTTGNLTMGWNDASANPGTHASMRPYAPPPATLPSTSAIVKP